MLGVLASSSPAFAANDFKLDGNSDLVWRIIDGAITTMRTMNGTAKTAVAGILRPTITWRVIRMLDLNGDTKADLTCRNLAGSIAI